jgi:hypothetical protein
MLARFMVVALLVVGCGGQVSSLAPASGCCTFAPASSCSICTNPPPETTSPKPTATFPPSMDLPGPGTELEAGRYTNQAFTPRVEFSVDEGWTTVQQTAGFFDIQDVPNSLDVVAVQFGNVVGADSAKVAANALADNDEFVNGGVEGVEIDGYDGFRVTLEPTDPLDTNPVVFHPVIRLTPGDVSIASARRLELTLLDVDGDVLAIMVGGSVAEWDHALEISGPVIESIQIGG